MVQLQQGAHLAVQLLILEGVGRQLVLQKIADDALSKCQGIQHRLLVLHGVLGAYAMPSDWGVYKKSIRSAEVEFYGHMNLKKTV